MIGIWATHFDGTVEGRTVTVQTHSDGGYRVKTTQDTDCNGTVFGDESSMAIIPPTPKGTPIEIEEETIDEVRKQLAQEGFSDSAIIEIVGHFPA